jgi:hypothetical protein
VLKKTITYEDFNGEKVSEDYFFHLSKAELVELELSHQGGLSESLKRIVEAEDGKAIIAEFKNIILTSYGVKSSDGRRFVKNQTLREEFESSEAYSTLFMELVTNTDAAIEFVNGVVPSGMIEEAEALAKNDTKPELSAVPPPIPRGETTGGREVITKQQFTEMSREEVEKVLERVQKGEVRFEF